MIVKEIIIISKEKKIMKWHLCDDGVCAIAIFGSGKLTVEINECEKYKMK